MGAFVVGQDRVERALRHAMSQDRLAHGLLFSGPSGVGRERAARGLAAGLLCEKRSTPDRQLPWGCGACRGCRRALAGNHPDVHTLMPEAESVRRGLTTPEGKKKPSEDILVDAVRELAVRLRMAPYEGGARVAIVVDAHRMNANAQNALLKTLEEPAPATWLVLVVPHERMVLPTIASRCLRLAFAPLRQTDVAEILASRGILDAVERARLADGSVARALAVDPKEPGAAVVAALQQALLHGSPVERLDAAESLGKERTDVDVALEELQRSLAGLMRDAVGRPEGAALSWRRARALIEAIDATRAAIAQNASVQLCLEELLLLH